MKIITRFVFLIIVVAFIGIGCGHGQLTDPSFTSGGSSGGTTVEGVSLESFTDETGAELEGSTISPNKSLVINFSGAVGAVSATVRCDGELQDIVIEQISETQYQILPITVWPQVTDCIVRLSTSNLGLMSATAADLGKSSFFTASFNVACGPGDDFSNSKTLGGCWKMNLEDVSVDNYRMLGGLLEIDGATAALDFEFDRYPMVTKRISGDTYTATLEIAYVVESFPEIAANDRIRISLFLSPDLFTLYSETPSFPVSLAVSFDLEWDEESEKTSYEMNIGVIDGVEMVVQEEEDVGHLDDVPYIGFIKTGNIVTPFFSVDRGKTKRFFDIDGSASIDMSQYIGDADALDIGIFVIAREHQSVATMFVEAFNVAGDAIFVAE